MRYWGGGGGGGAESAPGPYQHQNNPVQIWLNIISLSFPPFLFYILFSSIDVIAASSINLISIISSSVTNVSTFPKSGLRLYLITCLTNHLLGNMNFPHCLFSLPHSFILPFILLLLPTWHLSHSNILNYLLQCFCLSISIFVKYNLIKKI